jgi:hypothetical protein
MEFTHEYVSEAKKEYFVTEELNKGTEVILTLKNVI